MKCARLCLVVFSVAVFLNACKKDDAVITVHNPDTADKVSVDRFSSTAGHLQVRTAGNGLPGPNAAVNFDQGVFITKGFGPHGEHIQYYNFDVQLAAPAPIYVLYRDGESTPVAGQLNIIDVLPGEAHYNDFWQVVKVTVPSSYKANEVASYDDIVARHYALQVTTSLVNCPVVPEGSVATKRLNGESSALIRGWYDNKVVFYFNFGEKNLVAAGGQVPTAGIFVSFVINPSANPASGPASGFATETGNDQTHNVVTALPADAGYSPLWVVSAYDNTHFGTVNNLATAQAAPSVGTAIAIVNCPVVSITN